MPKRKVTAANDNPPPEPGAAREELGYDDPAADYSPAQRQAFRETFTAIGRLQLELKRRKDALGKAEEQADLAKAEVKTVQGEIEELGEKLFRIHKGNWQEELPGMAAGGGAPPAAGDAPEGIPAELWEAALEHVARCRTNGKGLDAKGLAMCLFSDRKAPHVARAEEILQALAARGCIVRDESDEQRSRWLPAEPAEAEGAQP